MANRAIRSPTYRADQKGVAWGADIVPALTGLFLVERDPRADRPNGWVGFAALPEGYEPEYAKNWRGDALRLDFDLTADPDEDDAVLVVTAMSTRHGSAAIEDEDFGRIELPEQPPSADAWHERANAYQAARRSADDHDPAAVKAYIAALPGWKGELAARIDEIIDREVPHVRRAIKWHAPFYGVEGQGWFASFSPLSKALKLTFTRGTSLEPTPPGGTRDDSRWLDLGKDDALDEDQIASWVRQAAALPGWLA